MSDKLLMSPWLPLWFWGGGLITGIMLVLSVWPLRHTPVEIYTDQATGCQYLYRPYHGGITPRLDGQGRHLCTAPAVK